MIDRWNEPVYVTRIWCMFEQFTAIKLEVPVAMIMSPDETLSFNSKILEGGDAVQEVAASLTNIDVENCKASVPADLAKVKQRIKTTVGFEKLNSVVKKNIAEWCGTQVSKMIKSQV